MRYLLAYAMVIATGIVCFAQPIQDSTRFHSGLQMIDRAQSDNQYLEAAEFFELLAVEGETNWLVHYYAGLSYTLASHENQNSRTRDLLIEHAQDHVDKALAGQPEEPELIVLQAMVYQAMIQVDPELRGPIYSMKATSLLKNALQLDPENPRAQLLLAYNTFYAPEIIGGGPENALPLFIKAHELFRIFRPESEFFPNWGSDETLEMIEVCKRESGVT